jgi:U4/U6 small nuclear ribonucleoprotein PRP3
MTLMADRLPKLAHPQHRYKVDVNAKQYQLTGVGVIYSDLNIVVVEGGSKSIKAYKKLMLRRIKWEKERLVGVDGKVSHEEEEEQEDDDEPKSNDLQSTELCALVWEGKVQKNQFPNFRYHICPTEHAVKDYFEKMGAIHYWNAAKNFVLETAL